MARIKLAVAITHRPFIRYCIGCRLRSRKPLVTCPRCNLLLQEVKHRKQLVINRWVGSWLYRELDTEEKLKLLYARKKLRSGLEFYGEEADDIQMLMLRDYFTSRESIERAS